MQRPQRLAYSKLDPAHQAKALDAMEDLVAEGRPVKVVVRLHRLDWAKTRLNKNLFFFAMCGTDVSIAMKFDRAVAGEDATWLEANGKAHIDRFYGGITIDADLYGTHLQLQACETRLPSIEPEQVDGVSALVDWMELY
ncbi:hypothetical protein CVO74_22445 [Xanthomonas prunicola]|uniref:Uncharacterized protein n=1 Tax=Xanthomonas prunicola TaxID=2053930 RepID=A0A2N3REU4_9XANT|nr:hypothetical protein XpruCFBP8353_20270 [Xanthomonas prunicola]PKV15164.1 hypothetical protein XpruCFBP8354_21005 [Xanthomonas prunicola]PKV19163.1 hypothetical protein CVO74_22445 [Xanthomonas prunicola]